MRHLKMLRYVTKPNGLREMDMLFTRRGVLFGICALSLVSPSIAIPAFAQSLDELRASGAIGERFDGYAVALSGSAKAEVAEINKRRKEIYETKAAEQGVSPEQVGMVYAKQIFKTLPKGAKFLNEDGSWVMK
ncbi:MAG: YdbL family protein [Kiloniellales bacterium]|nr:YdbL family protein [Kiloniellales bacterium]